MLTGLWWPTHTDVAAFLLWMAWLALGNTSGCAAIFASWPGRRTYLPLLVQCLTLGCIRVTVCIAWYNRRLQC